MKKYLLVAILALSPLASDIWPETADEWFAYRNHSNFDEYQQMQAMTEAIMLKMEELAPLIGTECDVNGAYHWQYRNTDHKGQFWTNNWRRQSYSAERECIRKSLEYIYGELNRFCQEGRKVTIAKPTFRPDERAYWLDREERWNSDK